MIAVLGLGVLGVQLVIVASMLIAALLGRGWLKAAAFLWAAFTLFGSIFTMGLLVLQSVTIVTGYLLASRLCDRCERKNKTKSTYQR